jgi:hypothetical protein
MTADLPIKIAVLRRRWLKDAAPSFVAARSDEPARTHDP